MSNPTIEARGQMRVRHHRERVAMLITALRHSRSVAEAADLLDIDTRQVYKETQQMGIDIRGTLNTAHDNTKQNAA